MAEGINVWTLVPPSRAAYRRVRWQGEWGVKVAARQVEKEAGSMARSKQVAEEVVRQATSRW